MTITTLTPAEFAAMAPKVDANQKAMREGPNPRNPETHPLPFPEVGNAETGKVEQYRLRMERPGEFTAYLSCDGQRVTVWTGDTLGYVTGGLSTWRDNFGGERCAFSFTMAGQDYYARGGGKGMYCRCKAYKGGKRG